jgi:hypothetical protein
MNFILRRITESGHTSNKIIGDNYHLIFDQVPDRDGYAVLVEGDGYDKSARDEIHAFIIWNDGRDWTPLYKKSTYYIMTENGKTFDTVKYFKNLESVIEAKSLSEMQKEFAGTHTQIEITDAHMRGDWAMGYYKCHR